MTEGLALLDEAMVAVHANELSPDWAGNIYCHMIDACHELADVRRAQQWTQALEDWLSTLPAAVLFTGVCRLHRSQILHILGEWDRALQDANEVCRELEPIYCGTAAEGHYLIGEINRLRGQHAEAERAYQRAHRLGRDPQPGLALLRLAQGQVEAAAAAIHAALIAVPHDRLARAVLRDAQVQIALAAGDSTTASNAAAELTETASAFKAPGLLVAAQLATGAIRLADASPAEALPALREACRLSLELSAPYDCARTRVLLAMAYEQLGDTDTAEREKFAATELLTELGVLTGTAALGGTAVKKPRSDGLTDRETEVLSCLADGRSNKEIAIALFISDKTVQRHLANIFAKLDVTSRTAAAAYAFKHGLTAQSRRC